MSIPDNIIGKTSSMMTNSERIARNAASHDSADISCSALILQKHYGSRKFSPDIISQDAVITNEGTPTFSPLRKSMLSPNRRSCEFKPLVSHEISSSSVESPAVRKRVEEERMQERMRMETPDIPEVFNPVDENNSFDIEKIDEVSSIPTMNRTSSFHRRERIRTLDQQNHIGSAASERMRRNTDSMLEDITIAKQLKRRLTARWQQITKRSITNTVFSDFIQNVILEGTLDPLAAVGPTSQRRRDASNIAMEACMGGYFSNIDDNDLRERTRDLFAECLQREEFQKNDIICVENEPGSKVYIIEEGSVQFLRKGQVAGHAHRGSSFGEISLIYGVCRQASVKVTTECVITWTIDNLSFRRVQALVALCSLKHSKSNFLKTFQRRASSLSDLQESGKMGENKIAFESLRTMSKIGEGTFGSVFMVSIDVKEDEGVQKKYFALKSMSKCSIVQNNNQKRVLIEKNVLQSLAGSDFIVSLLGSYQDHDSIFFLHDFVQGGNLLTLMIEKDILCHTECLFFCANIAVALKFIHKKGLIHRDLKPENCLIGHDGYVKICDFGMAKRIPSTIVLPNGEIEVVSLAFTMCGTPEFMAPEFLLSTGYDKSVDWWALGCILYEMYSGLSPFDFDGDLKKTFKEICLVGMAKKKVNLPPVLQKPGMNFAFDFVSDLLSPSKERIGRNSSNVLKHKYFADIGDENIIKSKKMVAPFIPKLKSAYDTSYFSDVKLEEVEVEKYFGDNNWCNDICDD